MDKELFLAGFDLNEDSTVSGPDVFNASLDANLTDGKMHFVELMGLPCNKECYAISIAAALTFLAGVYQVMEHAHSFKALIHKIKLWLSDLKARCNKVRPLAVKI